MRTHATAQFTARLGITLLATLASAQVQPVRWNAQYTQIYFDDIENGATAFSNGGASVVTDPALVLAGHTSIRLKNNGGVTTNPGVVPLSGNTTYIVEFKYHILNYGSADLVLGVWLFPPGDGNQQHGIPASNMLKSAPATGTFSAGALTANAAQYVFSIYSASPDSDVVIDDIRVLRQDTGQRTTQPSAFASLENLPFPRLGRYFQGGTSWSMRPGMLPLGYSVDQMESRLAFNDLIAGLWVSEQTGDPASIRRLRQLNPSAVILPYRMSTEQGPVQAPQFANVNLDYSFLQSIPDDWYVKDTAGNHAVEDQYPDISFMNISPSSPVVNGQTFISALLAWLDGRVLPSGLWDGVFLDNFVAEANIHIRNLSNPALLDFDYNRNGIRDETPASTSDMTRSAVIGLLQQFRAVNGDMQLVIGNSGYLPELSLAPYVNGYGLECVSDAWNGSNLSQASAAGWRGVFDAYRAMQTISRRPRITLLEGCGAQDKRSDPSYLTFTADDLRTHRMTLGTALLSDGFYSFDLHDNFTVPLWYDEYSVDAKGNAVEDRTKKGYLGAALTDAVELTDGGSVMLQESFEGAILPPAFRANPASAVSVSNGALIISNPDHTQNGSAGISTNPSTLRLDPGTYLLTFDWKVVDTLDHPLSFNVKGSRQLDGFRAPWVVTGDSGTVHFPFVISTSDAWSIGISMSGGGKVAIDNVRIVRGGVGPWRRDFENGSVLVNPLPQPRTFSATELAGTLNRTGIHRIKGTQAPDVNNGQPVTGDLTIGAFDAIILLADRLNVPGCTYSLDYSGQAFAAQGGTGSIAITTGEGCPWSVGALPAGVTLIGAGSGAGSGVVTFQVLPNVGGSVSNSLTIAGQTFTIEQSAASIAGLAAAGSLGQVASEGTWDFSLIGINLGASAATARFSFTGDNGGPLMLPLTFPQLAPAAGPELASTLDRTLSPNAQVVMESTGPDNLAPLVGSGQLLSNGNVSGFGIFSNPKQRWNAVVPLETRNASKYILAFDNTTSLTTGVAVASLATQAQNVTAIVKDDAGAPIGNPATISLSALGHTSFMLNNPPAGFPATAGKRGTIEFDTPPGGQLSVLGLRANGPALTTLPVLANVGTSGGSITHVAYNGGWTSVFYLVNTGTASAQFTLSFFDENGIALPVPLLLPQSGTNITTAALTQTLAAGAMLVVNTQAQDGQTLVIGSAQLTTTGNVSGFEIFRWTTFGQEASVPLETRTPNSFVLVFDDTNGLTTGVALANQNAAAANVTVRIYDDAGALLQSTSINLGNRGHTSFMLPDNYSVTANKRGMVEFTIPQGAEISAVGLRAKNDGTLTTIPVLTK
ncbi:MAG: hypothetical protein LAP61_26015 [Acidobacteriia bacterium]|nr:hypothetical protein [Terriglobia bacterium]